MDWGGRFWTSGDPRDVRLPGCDGSEKGGEVRVCGKEGEAFS